MSLFFKAIHRTKTFHFAMFLILLSTSAAAALRLPAVLSDHMVLQRDIPINLWGWAEPNETITVRFNGNEISTQADEKGHWQTQFPAQAASSVPMEMTFTGTTGAPLSLQDILVGEVWLCSGQSNMEWPLASTHSPTPEILRASHPRIRLLAVPRKPANDPQDDIEAEWKVCLPENVRDFSAVAYYFGRNIHTAIDMPIGLIESDWGGTRIETWTPPAGFQAVPEVTAIYQQLEDEKKTYRMNLKSALSDIRNWTQKTQDALRNNASIPSLPDLPKHPLTNHQRATALYNGMIHPLIRFAIRGAIWYQGEANRDDGLLYRDKMEALIKGWRSVWRQGDFPFYYVQLAPFNYWYDWLETNGTVPDFLRLPLIWEAQTDCLKIPNTGMAVVTDITNLYDIHPRNKRDVGDRLALWARAKIYGEDNLVYSGPLYDNMTIEGEAVRIHFKHTGSGLISFDFQPLRWFEIAGEDGIYYKAQAEINGNTVLVRSQAVKKPAAVRYAWHQIATPNLGNREGLPASPFRTDRW